MEWKQRREKEVEGRERNVPQGVNRLMGDMFARLGVRVHYSLEADNDDTLVSHAFGMGKSQTRSGWGQSQTRSGWGEQGRQEKRRRRPARRKRKFG